MASLQALEDEVEAFCRARAQALADEATGRTALADLGAVERAHPLAVSEDTVGAVQAALASPRTEEAQRPRLAALSPFLVRAMADAAARAADDALRGARRASVVSAAGTSLPLAKAWAAVQEEADASRRAALAGAADAAELGLLGAVQRRWEAVHAAPEGPGALPPPVNAVALEAQAVDFLRSTEDAWRDVLGYALRRLAPGLRPLPQGDAALHDVWRLSDAPLPGAFPVAERLGPVQRWLAAAGLTLEAQGRLRLEEDAKAGLPQAACFLLEVPERVLLVLPEEGHGSFTALLDATGRARAAAAVSTSAPLRARRLGDTAVRASAGPLVQGVLQSAPWLRRFLGHSRPVAREVARLSALAQLGQLRMLAARLPVVRGLLDAGPSLAGLRVLSSAVSEALFLNVGEGVLLPALVGWPAEENALRAAALAECLRHEADERFDAEDFRNPEAARWLASLWSRGTELDAEALAKDVSGAPLSLSAVAERLLAVLGA
jgi:hypothetical protein